MEIYEILPLYQKFGENTKVLWREIWRNLYRSNTCFSGLFSLGRRNASLTMCFFHVAGIYGSPKRSCPNMSPFYNWLSHIFHLLGGWPTPLKNMSSSVGMMTFPYITENKKCSKPPTSHEYIQGVFPITLQFQCRSVRVAWRTPGATSNNCPPAFLGHRAIIVM
jgi:hypothetical protein